MNFLSEESDCDDESERDIDETIHGLLTLPNNAPLNIAAENSVPSLLAPDISTLPKSRNSARLAGKIPSYRGMTAVSHEGGVCYLENPGVLKMSALSAQFNCLPECLNTEAVDLTSPKSFSKATRGPEGEKWLEACRKEIQAMEHIHVWELVHWPPNTNIIRGL